MDKKITEQMRNIPLESVLIDLGARKESGTAWPEWRLSSGDKVIYKVNNPGPFRVRGNLNKDCNGSIDLVMVALSYDFKSATEWLEERFLGVERPSEASFPFSRLSSPSATSAKPPVETKPPAEIDESKWPVVRQYLTTERGLDAGQIDDLHRRGLILSDSRCNAVFVRENGGSFRRSARKDSRFKQSVGGSECGAFVISDGDGTQVAVVESAIDALSLAFHMPHMHVIATGGDATRLEHYKHHLGCAVFAAFDADARGDQKAVELIEAYPMAIRMRVNCAKDWNEWHLQMIAAHQ